MKSRKAKRLYSKVLAPGNVNVVVYMRNV